MYNQKGQMPQGIKQQSSERDNQSSKNEIESEIRAWHLQKQLEHPFQKNELHKNNETKTFYRQNDKNYYEIAAQPKIQLDICLSNQQINPEKLNILPEQTKVKIQSQQPILELPIPIKTHFIKCFSQYKGKTIQLGNDSTMATQSSVYHQNQKIILTQPLQGMSGQVTFRVECVKYCIGFGIALKQVIQKHNYSYQSYGNGNELGHGLYIVTSQGYSWSHSEKNEDDVFRQGFNMLYGGSKVTVSVQGQNINFKFKKGQFNLKLNSQIFKKYTICFCAYLHEKQDSVSIL